jgi:hypothetical protein
MESKIVAENPRCLPEDVYEFFQSRVRVRANTETMRDRLRLMYARFQLAPPPDERPEDVLFEIEDHLDTQNKLIMRDPFTEHRLSMTGAFPHFISQDLESGEFRDVGFCDPLTLAQSALLSTIASSISTYGLFHGGAISLDGRGMLICARSGMGKTTLVLNLIRRGCGFLSDEVGCLDPENDLLLPFPRKINMRKDGMDLLGIEPNEAHTLSGAGDHGPEYAVDPEAIPGAKITGHCRIGAMVFLQGFADEPVLEPLAPSRALFALMNASIAPVREPGPQLMRFAPTLKDVSCHHLICGEPDATADMAMSLLQD